MDMELDGDKLIIQVEFDTYAEAREEHKRIVDILGDQKVAELDVRPKVLGAIMNITFSFPDNDTARLFKAYLWVLLI